MPFRPFDVEAKRGVSVNGATVCLRFDPATGQPFTSLQFAGFENMPTDRRLLR